MIVKIYYTLEIKNECSYILFYSIINEYISTSDYLYKKE